MVFVTRLTAIIGLFALLGAHIGAAIGAETTKITFLVTSDLYKMGDTKGRGGFARLAGVVKAERAKGGHVVYVHAGDALSPSLMSGFDKGEHIITLLNLAPPDFFVPGNHEFDFGPEVFKKRMAEAKFQKLAANLRDEAGNKLPGFADSVIRQFGPVKVGFVGLTDSGSKFKSSPDNLQFLPERETAKTQAAALRKAGADLVVGIVHANQEMDFALLGDGAFDVILSGDDHDLMVFFDGRRVLAEPKEEAEYVVAVDVTVTVSERRGRRRVSWWPNFRIIDTAQVTPDPVVAARVAAFEKLLSQELDVTLGETAVELDSRKASVRTRETAMGNLVADAIRHAVKADIAITNGGGIRGNKVYPPGSALTRRDILTELPFGNVTVKLALTGAEIKKILENAYSRLPRASGRFAHISGMQVTLDLTKPAGQRVVAVTIGGAPLDPAKTYTVATNDFLARGGDAYGAFRNAKVLIGKLEGKLMANDVMVYVRKLGKVDIPVGNRIILK